MIVTDARRVPLLDVDPDLGEGLDAESLEQARRFLRLPVVELAAGDWDQETLRHHPGVQGPIVGCVVLRGLITRDVRLGDRTCTHLYGPREFVSINALDFASLPFTVELGALTSAEVVLLDDRFLAAGQRWPRIVGRMLDSATSQLGRQCADQAISQLPRVEDRLLALFWHLADRWGRRQRDDIVIGLPLTHEALGRLIGAKRPTVSLGLRSLADDGLLRRQGATWLLAPSSVSVLESGPERRPRHRQLPAAAVRVPRLEILPPPEAGDRQRLRERVVRLHELVRDERARTREMMIANQQIREQVAQGRALRAAARAAAGSPALPA